MQNETENKPQIGKMRKRRETMSDGKRYIVYYTFGENKDAPETANKSEVRENV